MRSRILGSLATARKQSDLPAVVMSCCLGGGAVFELARSGQAENVNGYATFHGSLTTIEGQSYENQDTPILIMHGGADSSITMEDVATLSKELEASSAPYEIQVYSGAPHAFTVFGSDRYQETADQESWDAFSDFLGKNLGA